MNVMASALNAALLHFIWQGALVAILLWIALLNLRNRGANTRYIVACGALGLMALLPVVTVLALSGGTHGPVVTGTVISASPHAGHAFPAPEFSWIALAQTWIVPLWSAGVLLFTIRLAMSCGHVARLRRTGKAADGEFRARVVELARRMKVARPIGVLISNIAECPSVTGWLRPVILIPAAVLIGLDADQLEAVLAHEIAHIRRHDYLVNLLQTVVETLLFYHPAVWWVSARIRHERELCCDDLAVQYCGGAIGYARALTKLERLRPSPALTLAGNGGSLLYRIRRLTGAAQNAGTSKLPAIAAIVVGVAFFGINMEWARGQGVGGEVIRRTRVEYPEAARSKGIEGTVTVEATLDGEGNVTDARAVAGPAELRGAALRSVLDWRFGHAAAGQKRKVAVDVKKPREGEGAFLFVEGDRKRRAIEGQVTLEESSTGQAQIKELQTELLALQEKKQRQLAEATRLLEAAHEGPELRGEPSQRQERDQLAAELQLNLAATQKQLADLMATYSADNPQVREARHLIENLRAQLESTGQLELSGQSKRLMSLNTQLRNTEEQLAALQKTFGEEHPRIKELKGRLALLQAQLERADQEVSARSERQMERSRQIGALQTALRGYEEQLAFAKEHSGTDDSRLQSMHILALEHQVEAIKSSLADVEAASFQELSGRKLVRIDLIGIPESMRSSVHLPVQVGETISADSVRKVAAMAKSFTPALTYRFEINADGDAVLQVSMR